MQFIKQLCVVVVLGALGYGAYTTLTGKAPNEPTMDSPDWDSPPRIELPTAGKPSTSSNVATAPAGAAAPRFQAAAGAASAPTASAATQPPGSILPPPTSAAGGTGAGSAVITGVRPENSVSSYPSTNVPPGQFDGGNAAPLTPVTMPPAAATAGMASPAATPLPPSTSTSAVQPTSGVGPATIYPTSAGPTATPPIPTPMPGSSVAGSERPSMSEIQALVARNELAKALDGLSKWFDSANLSPEADAQVMTLLDQLAGTVVYSREHWLEPPHVVQQGETLQAIAAKYQVTPELLTKINGIADPLYLPTGVQLKVIRGPFDVLVDKSRRRLTVFIDGMYAGSFAVGFGRDQIIADGNYQVRAKTANPPYQAADAAVSADDPRNPLGERWIDLGSGLGIHGTNDPATYLSDEGRGVVRLSPRDAEDVFDMTVVGSRVHIRP